MTLPVGRVVTISEIMATISRSVLRRLVTQELMRPVLLCRCGSDVTTATQVMPALMGVLPSSPQRGDRAP